LALKLFGQTNSNNKIESFKKMTKLRQKNRDDQFDTS